MKMKKVTYNRKSLFVSLFFLFCLGNILAQEKWHNPLEAGFHVIQNRGWNEELSSSFARFPDRAEAEVRKDVWNLSRHSAGLAIHFYCNAPEIKVRYKVKGNIQMSHMPATGVSGVDLYSINSDGKWSFCFGNYSFGDTIQYTYSHLGKDNYHDRGFEYRLYLPLYNAVEWLEIGIDPESELTFIPASPEKPILLYGTSIAQGACASRPAMAWPNIVQRKVDYPLIDLGFSGNGRLEKEVLGLINEIDARLYILDCLPNLIHQEEDEIYNLIVGAVKQLRTRHAEPILLVEHIGYSNAETNHQQKEYYTRANQASKKAYSDLLAEGITRLFYITREELAIPADGWVDTIHPNDLGMQAQADAIERKIREILKLPLGNLITTQPVTQRREPNNYEWRHRHQSILKANRENPPRSVIFGNSITHFWGDETHGPRKRGADSWEKVMQPAGFRNMGYGWDRVENLLWRVYHDELEGYTAEKVVVVIGTNNIGLQTEEEITEGIRFLMSAIKERQPSARLVVAGIYPRRNNEPLVASINKRIETMAKEEGYEFINPGIKLLLGNGKIDESLFSDGLHPNEEGYRQLVSDTNI